MESKPYGFFMCINSQKIYFFTYPAKPNLSVHRGGLLHNVIKWLLASQCRGGHMQQMTSQMLWFLPIINCGFNELKKSTFFNKKPRKSGHHRTFTYFSNDVFKILWYAIDSRYKEP